MYVDRKRCRATGGANAFASQSHLSGYQGAYLRSRLPEHQVEDIGRPPSRSGYYEETALEANSDPNQIYELEGASQDLRRILDQGEIDCFAETFYKGSLDTHDRARRRRRARPPRRCSCAFEIERRRGDGGRSDPATAEELHEGASTSFMAQNHPARRYRAIEKLYTYVAGSAVPPFRHRCPIEGRRPAVALPDHSRTMLRLQAFRVEQKEEAGGYRRSPPERHQRRSRQISGVRPP